MWFKNLQLYCFSQPFALSAEALEERLAGFAYVPCRKLEPFCRGWVPPLGRSGIQLVHAQGSHSMVSLQKEEKIVPAAVVRDLLEDRIAEVQAGESRKVGRREREQMREALMVELLPMALSRRSRTFALIAPESGWLIVDSASRKGADELTASLRDALGTFPVVAPSVRHSVSATLSNWLVHGPPAGVNIEDECELRDQSDESGTIRCRGQNLESSEIRAHLDGGMEVSKLGVYWKENVSFVLDDTLAVKRLRFLDGVQQQANDAETESDADRFDVDMAIMAPTLTSLLTELVEWFGGTEQSAAEFAA